MKKNFRVTSINKEKAILENDHGKNLAWPIEELPEDTQTGDEIIVTINKNPRDQQEETLLAKNILNEVLNIED